MLLAGSGQTSELSALVDVATDPVDSGVVSDGAVVRVHEDDLEELEGRVFSNPVAGQNSQTWDPSANSFFGDGSVVSDWLDLVDTLGLWLSDDLSLGDLFLSATSPDSDSVDDVTLLGSVTESPGLLNSGWSGASVDDWELSVFPSSESEDEVHHVGLLLSPKLV